MGRSLAPRSHGGVVAGLAACLALAAASPPARAADYPQWRGPARDGVSPEKGLLQQWPQGGPKLLWQVKGVGHGFSTPAVAGSRLYLLSSEGLDNEYVQALDTASGKRVWSTTLGKVGNPNQQPNYPGARSTPTVDGPRLYALGSDGDLACLETATGKVVWKKSLRTDFGGQPGTWAYSESPLVDGDAVVVTPGGPDATLVKLNKASGAVIWKAAVPGGDAAAYGSAVVVQAGSVRQYAQILAKGLVGVNADTGKFLWRFEKMARGPVYIPTPVAGQACVYTSGGPGGALVRLAASGDGVTAEQAYMAPKLPNSIGGSVRVGDYLYGTTSQGLMCAEFATGTVKWEDRCVGPGSICYADGRLYVHGENGDMALVEATPNGYAEKGRFTLPGQPDRGQSKAWAYPVVANGRLYVRDLDTIWCYDVRAGR